MSFRIVKNEQGRWDIPSYLIRQVINVSEPETHARVCRSSWFRSSVVQAEPRVLFKMIDGRDKE
jgi:hypothetical protein